MDHIIITDSDICTFYKVHPFININSINRLCIELLNTVIGKGEVISTNNFNHLLCEMTANKNAMLLLQETVNSMKTDNLTSILSELNEIKEEYLYELKTLVISETTDKISTIMEANNTNLLNKTIDVIRNVIPNINAKQYDDINRSLYSFQKTISSDTQNLLKSVDTQALKEYMNNFEIKSSLMLQNIQQPILSFISSSEERINKNVNAIKENITNTDDKHMSFVNNVTSMLDNYKKKQHIEHRTNNHFISFLTKSFGNADISSKFFGLDNTTTILKRITKPTILIQNYELETNIHVDDINSFMNTISDENACGILISQYSGVSNKNDFQIEFHDNNIVIFIHNADYSNTKIEAAVNIIDHLYFKLHQFNKTGINDDFTIPKDILELINNEYQMFISQKTAVIDVLKESQKKVMAQLDEIKFPSLDKYLSSKYSAPIVKQGLKCDICKCYSANNLKALAAHKRGCMRKHGLNIKATKIADRRMCITPISVNEN